jgi:Fe-Mn family superoxide dismutase
VIFVRAGDPYDVSKIGLECPPLPFPTDALEMAGVSRGAVAKHYGQHQAYCRNTQRLAADYELENESLLEVVKYGARHRDFGGPNDLFSQAGQAWNHAFFWLSLRGREGPSKLSLMSRDEFEGTALGHAAVSAGYDSLLSLQEWLIERATDSFGSQWAWLVFADEELDVVLTDGADSPLTTPISKDGVVPLLVVDLWEHAYFLDYLFDRPRYVRELVTRALDWDRADVLMTLYLCD